MQVPLNTTVAQGDQLGFYIAEAAAAGAVPGTGPANLIPFCHLEYDISAVNGPAAPPGQVAFEQGSGQNSLRGLQANLSPVQVRAGKGIKFFSTVV